MKVNDVNLLLANTIRSRAYIQVMFAFDVFPARITLLPGEEQTINADIDNEVKIFISTLENRENIEFEFKPHESLTKTLKSYNQKYFSLQSGDINSNETIEELAMTSEKFLIYSGYPRVLIKSDLINIKKIIHVHAGYLPEYAGATGFYYGMLEQGNLGQSAILIDKGVDSGSIITKKRYQLVDDIDVDYAYDPITRAFLLKEVLEKMSDNNNLQTIENKGGSMHYVIHPVLKFLALRTARNWEIDSHV